MQSHETDLLLNPESHQAPLRSKEEANPGIGAEALVHGRTDALTPSAVMHLQKTAGNEAVTSAMEEQEPSLVKDVVSSGGGSPLDRETRGFMESRLGADFSEVRVHTDSRATDSAKSVQAHAYTVGNDVVFQSGKYEPESDSGRRMLAHELTHVVQQRSGPVDGTPAPGGIRISNPSDSFERAADSTADHVMSSAVPAQTQAVAPSAGVQRAAADEDDLQGYFVQREGAEAEIAEEEPEEQGEGAAVQPTFAQREAEEEDEG